MSRYVSHWGVVIIKKNKVQEKISQRKI
ncbi:hypothetical protein NP493_1627g01027 [Ridgeia piscesae]|uniref:Uncharacterized protein n=1 Tax=Ridgeia piscesae TaxID=27915 RepID=A0AAD9JYB1_RIDPI|nr:hypothetical protein NP493_1627g01027 [Ridgeia piscesae]